MAAASGKGIAEVNSLAASKRLPFAAALGQRAQRNGLARNCPAENCLVKTFPAETCAM
jgi:hypothetical protein